MHFSTYWFSEAKVLDFLWPISFKDIYSFSLLNISALDLPSLMSVSRRLFDLKDTLNGDEAASTAPLSLLSTDIIEPFMSVTFTILEGEVKCPID